MSTLIEDGSRPVYAARRLNGSEPAMEFLESLDEQRDRPRVLRVLGKLARGQRLSREDFLKLDGDIFELKDYQNRILCFSTHRGWHLTHGFTKKTKARTPSREIQKANEIRREALSRLNSQQSAGVRKKE